MSYISEVYRYEVRRYTGIVFEVVERVQMTDDQDARIIAEAQAREHERRRDAGQEGSMCDSYVVQGVTEWTKGA